MRLHFWSAVLLLLLLSACGSDNSATRSNNFLPLTSIEVTSNLAQIANLTSAQLTAIGNFSGFFTRDITTEAGWSSSDPTIATVDNQSGSEGRVTAVSPGNVTLTADFGSASASIQLTVSNATVTLLTISPTLPDVPRGLSLQFAAIGEFSDGTQQNLTTDATWTSSAPTIASISNLRGGEGLASALLEGASDISATFDSALDTTTMTVSAAVLQSLSLSPVAGSMVSLATRSFKATGHFSDNTTQALVTGVDWASSDTTVATVDSSGGVTSLKSGLIDISASLNGVNASTPLTVTGGDLQGISISPLTNLTFAVGTHSRFEATGQFSNNTSRDITSLVTWDSDNPAVAAISNASGQQGLLSALAQGSANITATYDTFNVSAAASVDTQTLSRLDVQPTAPIIFAGTSQAFIVTGIYATRSQDLTLDATWSSTDSIIASINNSFPDQGVAKAANKGVVTIAATFGSVPDGTASLDVQTATLQSISIAPTTVSLSPGATTQLAVTATYLGGSTQDVTADVSWSSPDESIAAFLDSSLHKGLLTGVNVGTVDVQADFGGQISTVTVNVP